MGQRQIQSDQIVNILPVGVVVPFAGSSAPTGFVLCDGSSLDSVANPDYAPLFAIIGTTYGGTGASNFNVPDLRGNTPVGVDGATFSALGTTVGNETHTLSGTEMPIHNHGGTNPTTGGGSHSHTFSGVTGSTNTTGNHNHSFTYGDIGFGLEGGGPWVPSRLENTGKTETTTTNGNHSHTVSSLSGSTNTQANHTHNFTIPNAGADGAHNNIQPSISLNYIISLG